MITLYTSLSWLLSLIYCVLVTKIIFRILIKRRVVSSIIAWLLIIYTLPLVGIIAYFLIGELYLNKHYPTERAYAAWQLMTKWLHSLESFKDIFAKDHSDIASPLFKLCERRQGISSVKGDKLQLFNNSDDTMYSLIRDIQLAQRNIKMVFYIWQSGGIVDQIAKSLILAEQRGVHCRLMLDSAGSITFFSSPLAKTMRSVGIEIIKVLKINLFYVFLRRMDLRQHRKIVLIDDYIAYTGSMNMVDPRYFKPHSKVGQWIDMMLRIEGPTATIMSIIYSYDWEIETGKRIFSPTNVNIISFKQKNKYNAIQTIVSGPNFQEDLIHQSLLTATYAASEYIIITTPYFIPSDNLMHAICTAAQRGVDVSIILPYKNDSVLVSWASRIFFSELLISGVKIYQFKGGLLHTKSMLVDGKLSLIGTVNFDMRSMWLNSEIILAIDNSDFSYNLAIVQNNYISRSCLLDIHLWNQRPLWQRFIECIFYLISPLL